ncbi:Uncharacterised protein [Salmonella enterica subsp. enterica serovar Sanjuan]|uniref:Uncharacterized protein n=1 Tax=Salmonella enterica subsp. enterica serovar Sanjuan TaxID=1160765 RepID=A0A3S4EWB8_SALET|nr:Uncharacterised protein [Salmonella enterica subsp. enterica serovar Sanjuan]
MGDVDRGELVLPLEFLDFKTHAFTQLGIEVGERFIEQDHVRAGDHRPGQRYALLLSAGELGGHLQPLALQPHLLQRFRQPGLLFADGDFFLLQAKADVVRHVEMRKQRIGLETHGGVAFFRRQGVNRFIANQNASAVRLMKAADHFQQGGFTAAARPEQGHELPLFGAERDFPGGIEFAERFGHLFQNQF